MDKDDIKSLIIETLNDYNVKKFPGKKMKTPEEQEHRINVETSKQKLLQKLEADSDINGAFWMVMKNGEFEAGETSGLYSFDTILVRVLRAWAIGLFAQMQSAK